MCCQLKILSIYQLNHISLPRSITSIICPNRLDGENNVILYLSSINCQNAHLLTIAKKKTLLRRTIIVFNCYVTVRMKKYSSRSKKKRRKLKKIKINKIEG